MRLSGKIWILCIILFALCGIMLGALQYMSEADQRIWGSLKKTEAAAIAVANFASESSDFTRPEKIAEIKKRVGLDYLEISTSPTSEEKGLEQTHSFVDGDLSIAETSAKNASGTIIKCRASSIIPKGDLKYVLLKWLSMGIGFGILTASFISLIMRRRIKDLRTAIKDGKIGSSSNATIKIGEFEDLAFATHLMGMVGKRKAELVKESLSDASTDSVLEQTLVSKIFGDSCFKIAGHTVEVKYARGKAYGSFFSKINDNTFVYGKIESKEYGLKELAYAVVARDISNFLLRKFTPWQAYVEMEKFCPLTHWNVVSFADGKIMREGFENDKWSSEELSGKVILSTSELGNVLRFYTKLELENSAQLMNLTVGNDGGLFIIIGESE